MLIRAAILDDEADGRDSIKIALERYCPEVSLAGVYDNPLNALTEVRQLKPDLIFLDIQMPQMSGFDFLSELQPFEFEVIFVTAFDQYAIKAIKFSALDYLLKPIDIDDFVHAVNKAKNRIFKKNSGWQYESMLHNVQQKGKKIDKVAVPTFEGIDFYSIADIIYCRADGSYTTLFLKDKPPQLVSKNLKDFESLLSDLDFCRVHHSYLINLNHVQKYIKGEGGYVILTGEHKVDISRRKKEEFLKMLNKI